MVISIHTYRQLRIKILLLREVSQTRLSKNDILRSHVDPNTLLNSTDVTTIVAVRYGHVVFTFTKVGSSSSLTSSHHDSL